MYYIRPKPNAAGNYGNPQSVRAGGLLGLPEQLLADYIAAKGFVLPAVEDGQVVSLTVNQQALDAYEAAIAAPAAVLRENAYNTEAIIEWDGGLLTVTEASQLWQYYAAEGSEKADKLSELIAAAKAEIRAKYPDEGVEA